MRVEEHAPAKVNLALHVLGRRDDGYHELDSMVAFADVGDRLTIEVADTTSLAITGPFAKQLGEDPENLVWKAHTALAQVLLKSGQSLPPVAFQLQKNLPVASGIGGGSADAAAALRGLLRLAKVEISPEEMRDCALSLGADVPVCVHGRTCRMRGIGAELSEPGLAVPGAIVLVNPMVATFTKGVFARLGLAPGQHYGSEIDPAHPQLWRNDLTNAAKAVVPEIDTALNLLMYQPALFGVRMSGSGATCFGLAHDLEAARVAASAISGEFPGWWVRAARLL